MKNIHRSRIWSISTEALKNLIDNSETITEVLAHFGLQNKGSNHVTLKNRCLHDNIDLSALKKRSINLQMATMRNRRRYHKIPISEILVENSTYNRTNLKIRLIDENIIDYKCQKCGLEGEWQGEKLSLILDHINGISNDNRPNNIRFLCPNCNSQTPTFAGRNKKYVLQSC